MNNAEFQATCVATLEGWLVRVTSMLTMDILAFQEKERILGSLLEIGVFKGKYFSVLARSAQKTDTKLLGIDTFEWSTEVDVREALASSADTRGANVILWKKRSDECTAVEILETLGSRPRFISIDGSHESEEVYLDLVLCEGLLSNKGIIAADDFLNPMTIGVNEAVQKFFLAQPRLIVPVAYIQNKLFLAHRSSAQEYRAMLEAAIDKDQEPQSKNFRELRAKARHFVEQRLWGHPILIC